MRGGSRRIPDWRTGAAGRVNAALLVLPSQLIHKGSSVNLWRPGRTDLPSTISGPGGRLLDGRAVQQLLVNPWRQGGTYFLSRP
jgi:hypothetical protein